jgi:hypothetical protein
MLDFLEKTLQGPFHSKTNVNDNQTDDYNDAQKGNRPECSEGLICTNKCARAMLCQFAPGS